MNLIVYGLIEGDTGLIRYVGSSKHGMRRQVALRRYAKAGGTA